MPDTWKLIVPGRPRPSQGGQLVGRPGLDVMTPTGIVHVRKARMYQKRRNTAWIETCRALAFQHRRRDMPWPGGVTIEIMAYVNGSAAMRKRAPFPLGFDWENVGKPVSDALKTIIFGDDKWVGKGTVEKAWGTWDRTEILVTRWQP